MREHTATCAVYAGCFPCDCSGNARDCVHGLLARKCDTCELESTYAQLEEQKRIVKGLSTELASLRLQVEAARAWLNAVDYHEMLVDQDPNYPGYQTQGLMSILNAREKFRSLVEGT